MSNASKKGFSHESTVNKSVEWYTPAYIFDALGETFDLDPCSPVSGKTNVPAKVRYTIDDDGLTQPWDGFAFVNPPYGPHTASWMHRLAEHGDGIGLVFARTDVKWFQELAPKMSAICFIAGRIRFISGETGEAGGTPGAGSMLVAFGERAAAALRRSELGVVVEPTQAPEDTHWWTARLAELAENAHQSVDGEPIRSEAVAASEALLLGVAGPGQPTPALFGYPDDGGGILIEWVEPNAHTVVIVHNNLEYSGYRASLAARGIESEFGPSDDPEQALAFIRKYIG